MNHKSSKVQGQRISYLVSAFFIFSAVVLDSSVSGYINFDKAKAHGAAITDAERSDSALTPKLM
jgi:hypothetical protein